MRSIKGDAYGRKRSVRFKDVAEMAGNGRVVANLNIRSMKQVGTKVAARGEELLEN